MENRVLEVFYGTDGKPYKDQERSVLFPVVGNEYQGANDFTNIRFYYQRLCGEDSTLVAVFKNAKGQLGCKPLSTATDSTRGEKYALLPISDFLTQYKGDIYISLQCYRGDANGIVWDDEQDIWVINEEVPTIRSTANIKMSVNYAPLIVGGGEEDLLTLQVLLSYIAEKSNIDDVVISFNDISQEVLSGYDNGQLFYDKHTDTYYKKTAISPYYTKALDGKGVLGAPHILCRLKGNNATIEQAIGLYANDMFVYNVSGKDYLFLVSKPSTFTAVAFDIETRKTYVRNGLNGAETLDSVISSSYEVDLDLGNRYVKTAGVKIGDIYHTIELIGRDMVIGSGLGDIILQPDDFALYTTSRSDHKTTKHEIANVDFVLDQHLYISDSPGVLGELEYEYICRTNAVIVFKDKLVFRYAYQDADYIYYRTVNNYNGTNLSGYDYYFSDEILTIRKADGTFAISNFSFDFYNKTQSEGKFATNFTASLDTTTYVLTLTLKNANGVALATQTIDLPLESIVTSMTYYDEYTYGGTTYHNVLVIVLATTSVPTIVPVGSLISGLEHEALVEVSDISTPLTASQLALMEYPNAMITYGNNVYLKAEDNGTYITLSVPYISIATSSGHEEATRKFIVVTKSSGAMTLTSDTTSFYNKSQTDTLLGEKADASSVVTDSDIETLGGAVNRIRKGNTWNEVAREVDMSTTPKVVQSVADLPADNDGYLYVVLDNGYLYSWDEANQEWAQRYQYTSDLLTITEVEVGDDDYSYITDKTNNNRPIQVESAKKDANGDVIDETYAKISDLETIDERLDNHDTDIAKLKKDVDYAMKYPLLYGTPTTDTEEEVGLSTSQLPATTLPKGLINYVGGMSQKVNQLFDNVYLPITQTLYDVTITNNGDGTITLNGTANNTIVIPMYSPTFDSGHYYLFVGGELDQYGINTYDASMWGATAITGGAQIRQAQTGGQALTGLRFAVENGVSISNKTISLAYVDLTDIYGAGNEPTSTSDARIKWLIHYLTENPQYNEGSIVNAPVEKLSSKGFNIWDEEWELGNISNSTGEVISGNYLVSKNFIKVISSSLYCFKHPIGVFTLLYFYDDNKNFIGEYDLISTNDAYNTFTIPQNVVYMKFVHYHGAYNHDICINLSGTMNDTYLPYQAPSDYPIPAEVQALDGYGLGIDDTLYNYIDFENKKFVKKVGSYTFSGNETFITNTIGRVQFVLPSNSLPEAKIPPSRSTLANMLCNTFTPIDDNHIETISRGISIYGYGGVSYMCFCLEVTTLDGDIDALRTFLRNNPTTVVYELAEPVETDISEYLDRDFPNENIIDTYQGGEVEFENDNDMGVPYSLTYQYKVE